MLVRGWIELLLEMITKLLARKKAIGGKTEITCVVYILGSLTSESD